MYITLTPIYFYFQVVPMENPNGRKVVEAGDLCERRNGIVFLLYNLVYNH